MAADLITEANAPKNSAPNVIVISIVGSPNCQTMIITISLMSIGTPLSIALNNALFPASSHIDDVVGGIARVGSFAVMQLLGN